MSYSRAITILALVALVITASAAEENLPPPPYWHFSVTAADNSVTQVIFPKIPAPNGKTVPTAAYLVQRSANAEFSSPTNLPNQYVDTGLTYVAVDPTPAAQGKKNFYRVAILDASGKPTNTSQAAQPLSALGALFVVQGVPSIPGVPCGDLNTLPCPSIKTALSLAPAAGATIYVTPGIYSGPDNTDIDFSGKAVTIASAAGPKVTMINATNPVTGLKSRAFIFKSGEKRTSVVSGFTITGGDAPTGGCISIENAAPTIQDSLFYKCNSTTGFSRGGAIYAKGNPAPGPLVQRTMFIYNQAQEGAGIYVESSQLEVNQASFEWGICGGATGRGGGICAILADITANNVSMSKGITGFGGGAMIVERSRARLTNFLAFDNLAGNFGGAFLLFGSELYVSKSNFSRNTGSIFAGGLVVTSSIYEANDTVHNENYGRVGGGAVKVLGGTAILRRCQVNGNSAGYGAGFDIAESELSALPTNVLIEDTEVMNNVVPDRGAGFYLDSFDTCIFRNVRFGNNTATKGGAGWCNAANPATFDRVSFEGNVAQLGGGLYADTPCKLDMKTVSFKRNTAIEYGAGIALGDGTNINITNSIFEGNGVSGCSTTKPPVGGGAIMVGVEQFKVNQQCGLQENDNPSKLSLRNTTLVGNVATNKGGAILVESGVVVMNAVQVSDNYVTGDVDTAGEGVGGGIAVTERCDEEQAGGTTISETCSTASAEIYNSAITGNAAKSAGGGIHFSGASTQGKLVVKTSMIAGNKVSNDVNQDSVGGGLYLGRPNFNITEIKLIGNNAFYGGGVFLSADLSKNSLIAFIQATNNTATLGSTAYWLRSKSPNKALDYTTMLIEPLTNTSLATEVLKSQYNVKPPQVIQSGKDVETFAVDMVDYYGNPGLAESGGACVVAPDPTVAAVSDDGEQPDPAVVQSDGAESGVNKGTAVFSQVFVTGSIGADYGLKVTCTPQSLGRSRFLQLKGESLPPLSMPVTLSQCVPGDQPVETTGGEICVKCSYNTFNLDGQQCLDCPEGAECPGGSDITSQANYWRSDPTNVDFYPCRTPDICNAGPETGDAACDSGQRGPLCAVCEDDYFQFGGRCRACDDGGQAKAMLAVSVIVIAIMCIVIFAVDLQFGKPGTPGLMSKAKIFIAHLQILAVLKEYDVKWPKATSTGLSWFEAINIGFGMMAPSCFFGDGFSFWWVWIFQMCLPIIAVTACLVFYFGSVFLLKRKDPDGRIQADPKQTKGVVPYLVKLKVRCWKNGFWLVTLLYPRCSMTALQMFSTQELNTGTYLTADYDIMVKPPGGSFTDTYVHYMIPGGFMLAIIAFGIPFFWFIVIWRNRKRLDDEMVAKKYGFLYGDYSREVPYWETAEMLRKFMFAFIPVFVPVQSDGSLQGTVGQILILFYLILVIWLMPFAHAEDNGLQAASLVVLWLVLLAGCTAKWSNLSPAGEKGLAAAELLLSSVVGFVAISLIVISLRNKRRAKKAEELRKQESGEQTEEDDKKHGGDKDGQKRWGLPKFLVQAHAGASVAPAEADPNTSGKKKTPEQRTLSIEA